MRNGERELRSRGVHGKRGDESANEYGNERREVASRHCCQAVKTSLET